MQRYCFFLILPNFFHYFFKKKLIFRKMDNFLSQIYNKTPHAITARGIQFTINQIQICKPYAKVRLFFDICKSFVQFVPFWNMLLQRLQRCRAPSVCPLYARPLHPCAFVLEIVQLFYADEIKVRHFEFYFNLSGVGKKFV